MTIVVSLSFLIGPTLKNCWFAVYLPRIFYAGRSVGLFFFFFFFFSFKTLGQSVNHFFLGEDSLWFAQECFAPTGWGKYLRFALCMYIKRAECGETTWGLHFMQKQQCNENNR